MRWASATACLFLLLAAMPARADAVYRIRSDRWTAADERGYGEFLAALGDSACRSVDACLKSPANPFRASDPAVRFWADCADLPYFLRFYYAWKRGLPFSYAAQVSPRGRARDIRYSASGNRVASRRDVLSGAEALSVMNRLRDGVSSATYRIDPELEAPLAQDFYSPALAPGGIRPGTVIYDPNGHLAVVYRVERNGRIHYIDAHPDNSLTRGTYDVRFVRSSPGMGAGFKNWRPLHLEGGRREGGVIVGGRMVPADNRAIPDFALTQYYGTGARQAGSWRNGQFLLGAKRVDYYDYVRAMLSGGSLHFDPVREIGDMVASNCADLHYRAEAVDIALAAGSQNRAQPERLPPNIYGADGDWETYSTPSRDARLKTAFKALRDTAERFLNLWRAKDPSLNYQGAHLADDMLAAYDRQASACRLSWRRSDGVAMSLGYEEARRRLFRLSFDPHHCAERRWGAEGAELAACRDGAVKRAWYEAQQSLRNQIDRTYDARMDFSLRELESGAGGVAAAPDTDTRAFLLRAPRP